MATKPMSVDTLRRLMAGVDKPAADWERLYEAGAWGRYIGCLVLLAATRTAAGR